MSIHSALECDIGCMIYKVRSCNSGLLGIHLLRLNALDITLNFCGFILLVASGCFCNMGNTGQLVG